MKKILLAIVIALGVSMPAAYAFSDVDAESEMGKAISSLVDYGVIDGYSDGTFKPEKSITRAEMCKMINILFNFTDIGTNEFLDVSYEDWYYTQVLIASEYEYIKGFNDGTFRGNDNITREQVCAVVCRITPLLEIDDTMVITDPVSEWARNDVQMIANHKLLKTDDGGKFRAKDKITRGELSLLLYRFIPEEKSDAYEEGYSGKNAEIALENAVVLANLKAAVRDIESVQFNENEKQLIEYVLIGLNGTIEAGLNGNLVNKHYVVKHYWDEIEKSRDIYKTMTEEEQGYFHSNLVKLNNSTLIFLQSYFLGDKPPV